MLMKSSVGHGRSYESSGAIGGIRAVKGNGNCAAAGRETPHDGNAARGMRGPAA